MKDREYRSISGSARDIKLHGFDSPPPPIQTEFASYSDARTARAALLEESFVISAVILDRVFTRSFETFDHYTSPPRLPYPYNNIGGFTSQTLNEDLVTELLSLQDKLIKQEFDDPITGVFKRFLDVKEAIHNHGMRTGYELDIMSQGIKTATDIMTDTFEAIPKLFVRHFRRLPTTEEVRTIAKNIYPFIASLASLHGDDFEYVREKITVGNDIEKKRVFNLSKVRFNDDGSPLAVVLKKDPLKSVALRFRKRSEAFPRHRCPAIVNFGDDSGIKKLWDFWADMSVVVSQKNML